LETIPPPTPSHDVSLWRCKRGRREVMVVQLVGTDLPRLYDVAGIGGTVGENNIWSRK